MSDQSNIEIPPIPDVIEPLLGFRVWRFRENDLSLWSVVKGDPLATKDKSQVAKQNLLSNTTPDGYWPKDNPLAARCLSDKDHPVPDPDCMCGIYSTYDVDVIAQYISSGPVLGLVQGYGQVIAGEPDNETIGGFRAQYAKIVCIFAISEDFTIPHRQLRKLGREYNVPVIRPWSDKAQDYAAAVRTGTLKELGEQKS